MAQKAGVFAGWGGVGRTRTIGDEACPARAGGTTTNLLRANTARYDCTIGGGGAEQDPVDCVSVSVQLVLGAVPLSFSRLALLANGCRQAQTSSDHVKLPISDAWS